MTRRTFRAMGTEIELIVDADDAERALDGAEAEIHRLAAVLTRFEERSELSRLNEAKALSVHDDVSAVVELALQARDSTGGRFDPTVHDAVVAEGCYLDRASIEQSIVGIRTNMQSGATIRRSVLLGADYYEADDDAPARGANPKLGVGRDAVLDRVIVDKNARIGDGARLVNEKRVQDVRAGEVLYLPSMVWHKAEALEDTLDVDVFSPPRADWLAKTDTYLRK